MKPINEAIEIWNERVKKRMKDKGLSQREFADEYKNRFGYASQADVSRWVNIGDIDKKNKSPRKFPEYNTMRNIAEILGVSVAYLTGETDFESYDIEKTSLYTGLSSDAIKSIKDITSGKAIPPFHDLPDSNITAALNLLLSNKFLVEYLNGICDLAGIVNYDNKPFDPKRFAEHFIPPKYQNEVLDYWYFLEEEAFEYLEDSQVVNQEDEVEPPEIIRAYASLLDFAFTQYSYPSEIEQQEIKSSRYALQEIQVKILDELLKSDKISQLYN